MDEEREVGCIPRASHVKVALRPVCSAISVLCVYILGGGDNMWHSSPTVYRAAIISMQCKQVSLFTHPSEIEIRSQYDGIRSVCSVVDLS